VSQRKDVQGWGGVSFYPSRHEILGKNTNFS